MYHSTLTVYLIRANVIVICKDKMSSINILLVVVTIQRPPLINLVCCLQFLLFPLASLKVMSSHVNKSLDPRYHHHRQRHKLQGNVDARSGRRRLTGRFFDTESNFWVLLKNSDSKDTRRKEIWRAKTQTFQFVLSFCSFWFSLNSIANINSLLLRLHLPTFLPTEFAPVLNVLGWWQGPSIAALRCLRWCRTTWGSNQWCYMA